MNIKNYTSTVEASKSMARIEELIIEIGATNINKKIVDKVCTGITFLYFDNSIGQTIAFHLSAQVDECFKILWKEIKRPGPDTKKNLMAQANRTAWKILCDLVEVQVSMILLGQAKPLQMFLPFVYDLDKQETLYEKIASGKMQLSLTN